MNILKRLKNLWKISSIEFPTGTISSNQLNIQLLNIFKSKKATIVDTSPEIDLGDNQ